MSKEPRNLLIPFRRDQKNDFATGTGEELERSKVTQVLATEGATPRSAGELPWRTNFGSALHLLRHQRNDEALGELARVYCRDALNKWLPTMDAEVDSTADGPTREIRLNRGSEQPVVLKLEE